MSSVRVIKKYPNRRLYDTEESRYITLSDIRDLVLGMVEFVVVDKKNGNNITRCVLMQVISEREQNGDPVMSQAFLSEIIRHHDQITSAPLSTYLEQSLSTYLNQQPHSGRDRAGATTAPPPSEATPASVTRWKSLQCEGRRLLVPGADAVQCGTQEMSQERKKAS